MRRSRRVVPTLVKSPGGCVPADSFCFVSAALSCSVSKKPGNSTRAVRGRTHRGRCSGSRARNGHDQSPRKGKASPCTRGCRTRSSGVGSAGAGGVLAFASARVDRPGAESPVFFFVGGCFFFLLFLVVAACRLKHCLVGSLDVGCVRCVHAPPGGFDCGTERFEISAAG